MKLNKLIPLFLYCYASVVSAALTDTSQPIHIDSLTQEFDMKTNTVTFTGKVQLTQGSLKILADKVVVEQPGGQKGAEIISGYGTPATFDQVLDNGKPVHGEANTLIYNVHKDLLTMHSNALLKQVDSQITGNLITYEIEKQRLKAKSSNAKNKRVITILTPAKTQK